MYLLRKVYTHIRIMIGTSETYLNNKQKQYTVMLVLPASPTKTKNTASFMLSWYESLLKSHWNQVGAFLVFIALYRPTITS